MGCGGRVSLEQCRQWIVQAGDDAVLLQILGRMEDAIEGDNDELYIESMDDLFRVMVLERGQWEAANEDEEVAA